jgi:hypothetical protein
LADGVWALTAVTSSSRKTLGKTKGIKAARFLIIEHFSLSVLSLYYREKLASWLELEKPNFRPSGISAFSASEN